jgi:FkbM family methyltransferase
MDKKMKDDSENISHQLSSAKENFFASIQHPKVKFSGKSKTGEWVLEYQADSYPAGSGESSQLVLDPSDFRDAAFTILREGEYEPILAGVLQSIAKQSTHFYDVGANIGFYSCLAARSNLALTVNSFEPNPTLWEKLEGNLDLNDCRDRVSLERVGLGSETASYPLYVPPGTGSGGGSLRDLHPEEGRGIEHIVNISAPKDLNISKTPQMVKIDVEGAELSVIEGLKDIILTNKPTIFIELLRKWMKAFGNHPMDVVQILLDAGYKIFAIGETGLIEVTEIGDQTVETNFLFVHSSQKSHFQTIAALAEKQLGSR